MLKVIIYGMVLYTCLSILGIGYMVVAELKNFYNSPEYHQNRQDPPAAYKKYKKRIQCE